MKDEINNPVATDPPVQSGCTLKEMGGRRGSWSSVETAMPQELWDQVGGSKKSGGEGGRSHVEREGKVE